VTNRRCVIAIAILCFAGAAAAGAEDEQMLLTGDADAVWLVRRSEKGLAFDVLVRPAGKKWKWIIREVPGVPSAAAAAGSQLNVLLRKPLGHLVFNIASKRHTPGLNPSPKDKHNRWPKGASPIAICASGPFGDSPTPTLVAVLPYKPQPKPPAPKQPPTSRPTTTASPATRPSESQPTTTPATRPTTKPTTKPTGPPTKPTRFARYRGKPRNLAVFHTVNPEWQLLTDCENVNLPADSRVFVTIAADTLYMLLAPPKAPNSLLCWKKDQPWREIILAPAMADAHVVAMVTIEDRPVIVYAARAETPDGADQTDQRELHLAAYEGPDKGLSDQTVTREGKAVKWAKGQLPLAVGMGQQCGLFWSEGETKKFATVALNGQVVAVYDVEALSQPPIDDDGGAILQKFMWGLVAGTFFCMFLLRPRSMGKPFSMPEHVRPGRLGRRLFAGMLDFVPFIILGTVVFGATSGPLTQGEAEQLLHAIAREHQIPVRLAYAIISMCLGYAVYGFFMERRYGATLGKMLLKLRVIGSEGTLPGTREAALRNLTKIFELSWPLMLLVPLINRRRFRLGDLIARTAVIEYDTSVPPPGDEDSQPHPPDDQHQDAPSPPPDQP